MSNQPRNRHVRLRQTDLPRLTVWPYFWQQSEYGLCRIINDVFLALAVNQLYAKGKGE